MTFGLVLVMYQVNMSELKRGPIINVRTLLPFIRTDRIDLPKIAGDGFGDDWRSAAYFLAELAKNQINSYPHYSQLTNPERIKVRLLEELGEFYLTDSLSHLFCREPMGLLSNLEVGQLNVILQAFRQIDDHQRTVMPKLLIQGILLGRQTAK